MANRITVNFSERAVEVPSCFYAFVLRYPLPDGTWYQGFVAASADKIFERTNVTRTLIRHLMPVCAFMLVNTLL